MNIYERPSFNNHEEDENNLGKTSKSRFTPSDEIIGDNLSPDELLMLKQEQPHEIEEVTPKRAFKDNALNEIHKDIDISSLETRSIDGVIDYTNVPDTAIKRNELPDYVKFGTRIKQSNSNGRTRYIKHESHSPKPKKQKGGESIRDNN